MQQPAAIAAAAKLLEICRPTKLHRATEWLLVPGGQHPQPARLGASCRPSGASAGPTGLVSHWFSIKLVSDRTDYLAEKPRIQVALLRRRQQIRHELTNTHIKLLSILKSQPTSIHHSENASVNERYALVTISNENKT